MLWAAPLLIKLLEYYFSFYKSNFNVADAKAATGKLTFIFE